MTKYVRMHLKFSRETLAELDRRAGPRKRSALIARILDEHIQREEAAGRLAPSPAEHDDSAAAGPPK